MDSGVVTQVEVHVVGADTRLPGVSSPTEIRFCRVLVDKDPEFADSASAQGCWQQSSLFATTDQNRNLPGGYDREYYAHLLQEAIGILAEETLGFWAAEKRKEELARSIDSNDLQSLYLALDCANKGRISLEDMVRELYVHDLEQLDEMEWASWVERYSTMPASSQGEPTIGIADLYDSLYPLTDLKYAKIAVDHRGYKHPSFFGCFHRMQDEMTTKRSGFLEVLYEKSARYSTKPIPKNAPEVEYETISFVKGWESVDSQGQRIKVDSEAFKEIERREQEMLFKSPAASSFKDQPQSMGARTHSSLQKGHSSIGDMDQLKPSPPKGSFKMRSITKSELEHNYPLNRHGKSGSKEDHAPLGAGYNSCSQASSKKAEVSPFTPSSGFKKAFLQLQRSDSGIQDGLTPSQGKVVQTAGLQLPDEANYVLTFDKRDAQCIDSSQISQEDKIREIFKTDQTSSKDQLIMDWRGEVSNATSEEPLMGFEPSRGKICEDYPICQISLEHLEALVDKIPFLQETYRTPRIAWLIEIATRFPTVSTRER